MICSHISYICCRKSLGQLQFHLNDSSSFSQEIRHSTDIATARVSFCNKYKQTQHIFHVDFMLMQPNSHSYKFKDLYVHKFKDNRYL